MRVLVGAASVVVIAAGLKAAAPLLIPLVVALFMAIVCSPLVAWLRAHRVPTALAVTLTVLGLFAVFAGPGALVTAAIRQFVAAVPDLQQRVMQNYNDSLAWLQLRGFDTSFLRNIIDPARVLDLAVSSVSGLVTILSLGFLVVLATAFMLAYGAALAGPPGTQPSDSRGAAARIVREVQIYLGVKTAVSIMTGLVAWSYLVILGIDFALLWGLLTFVLNYIPNIGSVVAAIPPILIAFEQYGVATALFVLIGYIAINQAFGSFLEPYLMGQRLRIAPLAVLVSVVVWGWIWGPLGALLSVPITMVIKIGLENSAEGQWIAGLLEGTPGATGASGAPGATGATDAPGSP